MTVSNKMVNQYRWLKKKYLFDFRFCGRFHVSQHFFVILKTKSTNENKGLIKTISPTPGSSA